MYITLQDKTTFVSKMPTVRVETNLGPEFFPDNCMPMFIIAVAELLGKDKKVMKYVFHTNVDMTIVSSSYSVSQQSRLFYHRVLIMLIIRMVTFSGLISQLSQCSVIQTSATI